MKDYHELMKKYKDDELQVVHELSDNLTDTRYLFEVIYTAIQAYREHKDTKELHYLDVSLKVALKQLRMIEDALANSTPIILNKD